MEAGAGTLESGWNFGRDGHVVPEGGGQGMCSRKHRIKPGIGGKVFKIFLNML